MVEFEESTDNPWNVSNMFKRVLVLALLGLIAIFVAIPFLVTSNQPQNTTSVTLDAAKIDQAKAFLKRNDPRNLEPGEFVTLWVDEEEISLAGN